MHLTPDQPNPQKWEKFYKDMALGKLKSMRPIQKGGGGSLGPRVHSRHYTSVQDTVEPTVVSPAEMVVQQARSEIKHRNATGNSGQRGGGGGGPGRGRPAGPGRSAGRGRSPGRSGGPPRVGQVTKQAARGRPAPKKAIKPPGKRKATSYGSGGQPGRTVKKTKKSDIFGYH